MKRPELDTLAGVSVPRETWDRLSLYVDCLERWSATINLIGRADREAIWIRHVADAVQLSPLLGAGHPPYVDVGSGAGVPGLVLAILTDSPVHLIEADQRKCAFLREAARLCGASVTVHAQRIEDVQIGTAGILTARALAPLPQLLHLTEGLRGPDTLCIFPKGRGAAAELTAARAQWQMTVIEVPSRTDPAATILLLREIRHVSCPE